MAEGIFEMTRHMSPSELTTLFWGKPPRNHRLRNGSTAAYISTKAFISYFELECTYFTHDDIDLIKHFARCIKDDVTQQEILADLKTRDDFKSLDLGVCQQTLILTARVLVLCNIGRVDNQVNPRQYLEWKDDENLRALLSRRFETPPQLDDRPRLPKSFDAWAIEKIGGIRVQLTDNLSDHLLLINDDSAVLVFHHASALELQTKESLFPKALIDETLSSIALLFPQSEFASPRRATKEKREWFTKLCQGHVANTQCEADERLAQCGTLHTEQRQIEKFHYWRDRLVVLKQAYDDSTPQTLSQWWFDRRNGPQWYTFWVAILVLIITTFLGLVQCIESALQVYKAYHPS